jgi:hypothetical protein
MELFNLLLVFDREQDETSHDSSRVLQTVASFETDALPLGMYNKNVHDFHLLKYT